MNPLPSYKPSGVHFDYSPNLPTWFTGVLSDEGWTYNHYSLDNNITETELNKLINVLMDEIYNRHHSDYVISFDYPIDENGASSSEMFELYAKVFHKLIEVLNLTLPKYYPLFVKAKEYSANPVAPLHSSSVGTTRFNDTPQSYGDFNDDAHATNVSKSTSSSEVDSGSIVERMDAAFKGWRSIILEWTNEFNQLFFKEEQIND